LVTKVKSNINSIEVHPQLSNNGHLVVGVLVHYGQHLAPQLVQFLNIWQDAISPIKLYPTLVLLVFLHIVFILA
jgi:hypothetical protein